MEVRLHANATTTPRIRRAIQQSRESATVLAERYGVSLRTVRRWQEREDVADRAHTPHRLSTTLSAVQEAIVVELRKTLLLSLDDLLVIAREFLHPELSRSALDRCLRRHGVSRLRELYPEGDADTPKRKKTFKDYAPGFVHVDYKYLPQMPDEPHRRYLFVAIDRASRWVYLELLPDKSARTAERFLRHLLAKAPFRLTHILSDNDKAFTDRFSATGERQPTGKHAFDRLCGAHHIEHRPIPPRRPQTNGMVERFNGRIAEVLNTTHCTSRDDLETLLRRYGYLYNHHIPQKALAHRTPIQALQHWQRERPGLFVKRVANHPGPDM